MIKKQELSDDDPANYRLTNLGTKVEPAQKEAMFKDKVQLIKERIQAMQQQ